MKPGQSIGYFGGNGPLALWEAGDIRYLESLARRVTAVGINGRPEHDYAYRGSELSPKGICEYCELPFGECSCDDISPVLGFDTISIHGTQGGARQHYRRGEKPCEECRQAAARAKNESDAQRRARRVSTP